MAFVQRNKTLFRNDFDESTEQKKLSKRIMHRDENRKLRFLSVACLEFFLHIFVDLAVWLAYSLFIFFFKFDVCCV